MSNAADLTADLDALVADAAERLADARDLDAQRFLVPTDRPQAPTLAPPDRLGIDRRRLLAQRDL